MLRNFTGVFHGVFSYLVLNEVLSLNAQEFVHPAPGDDTATSSMKS